MKKDEIFDYLKKELHDTKEYTFIVIDARWKKPRLFEAWQDEVGKLWSKWKQEEFGKSPLWRKIK